MQRRRFLQAAATLGSAGVLTAVQGDLSPAAGRGEMRATMQQAPAPARSAARFFQDEEFNFVFHNMLGGAYYGVAEVGTCLAIADQITDGDAASAFRAMTAAGDRFAAV